MIGAGLVIFGLPILVYGASVAEHVRPCLVESYLVDSPQLCAH